MIEVIYKEEKPETEHSDDQLSLPRNVRQIGLAAENYRIYMEDYVYTFRNSRRNKGGYRRTGGCAYGKYAMDTGGRVYFY